MLVTERRQPERLILLSIFLVAHTHGGRIEQAYDRGDYLRLGQSGEREVRDNPAADLGKRRAESDHPAKLRLVADLPVCRVIAILLAALRVITDGLHMAIGKRRD